MNGRDEAVGPMQEAFDDMALREARDTNVLVPVRRDEVFSQPWSLRRRNRGEGVCREHRRVAEQVPFRVPGRSKCCFFLQLVAVDAGNAGALRFPAAECHG